VEAYASGGFYQEGKSAADLAAEAEGYRARGFKGMKMKVGRNPSTQTHLRELIGNAEFCEVDPSEDLARVAAVREALGPKGKLIGRGAVDIVQLDLAWSGGFSEGRRIVAYAHAHHRMVAPHAFAGAVLLMASLHFAAAIPNSLNLEWDQNPNAIREKLLKEPPRLETDGTVKVPERPGLGI